VDLATLPLYVRAGAIIPVGSVRQYTTEPKDQPVTLKIYPGAPGRFTWYEDDGTSFRYRHGEFTRIECTWDDAPRKLHLAWHRSGQIAAGKKVSIEAMDTTGGILKTLPSHAIEVKL
jgi:alpha-glucosidase (family GH31 glycosyl hydrolase)